MTSRIAFGTARSFRSEQPKTVNGSNTKVLQQRRKRFITAATVPAIPSPESVGESICGGRSYGLVGLSSTERYPRLTPERFRHQLNLLGPKRGRRRSGGRSWSDEILGTAVNCSPPETWRPIGVLTISTRSSPAEPGITMNVCAKMVSKAKARVVNQGILGRRPVRLFLHQLFVVHAHS